MFAFVRKVVLYIVQHLYMKTGFHFNRRCTPTIHSIGQMSSTFSFSKCHRGSIDRSSTIANAIIFRLRSLSDHREEVSWGLVLWISACPSHQSSASKAIRNSNSHANNVKNQEKTGPISEFGIPNESLNHV